MKGLGLGLGFGFQRLSVCFRRRKLIGVFEKGGGRLKWCYFCWYRGGRVRVWVWVSEIVGCAAS